MQDFPAAQPVKKIIGFVDIEGYLSDHHVYNLIGEKSKSRWADVVMTSVALFALSGTIIVTA